MQNKNERVTDDISALKRNLDTKDKQSQGVQWLLFAIVLLALGMGGIWLLRPGAKVTPVLVYNSGFTYEALEASQKWISEAAQQSINAYLDVGTGIQILDDSLEYPSTQQTADWLLSGAVSVDPSDENTLTLSLSLQSNRQKGDQFEAEIKGMALALNDLSARASAQILTWLEKDQLSSAERLQARAEIPSTPEAQRHFAEGNIALSKYDGREAVKHFQSSIAAGGEHPVVYNALAGAWQQLGYSEEAKQAARFAFENRENLSREKQLEIEGQYYQAHNDLDRAADAYKALKAFHPADLSYGMRVAQILLEKSDMESVWLTIDDMRRLPAPQNEDPRIDIIEARYWHQKGDYAQSIDAAEMAIAKARKSGEPAILTSALMEAVYSDSENKRTYLEEVRSIFEGLENPRYFSRSLSELGRLERYAGDLNRAEDYYRQALSVAKVAGDEAQVAVVQNGLAIVLDLKNQLKDSYELKREVLAYNVSRGLKGRESIGRENIGISLFKMGRLDEAEESFNQAYEIFKEIDDTIGIAWHPYHISRIRSRQGNLEEALQLAELAVQNSEKNPEGMLEFNAKHEVSQVLYYQGNDGKLIDQFRSYEKAFAENDIKISVGESALMIARIAHRQGDITLALEQQRQAAEIYEDANAVYYQLEAVIVESDLAFVRDTTTANNSCLKLTAMSETSEYALTALRAKLRAIRCAYLDNTLSATEAVQQLDDLIAEAEGLGLLEPQLEGRQIAIQILELSGDEAQLMTRTKALAEFAHVSGWWSPVSVEVRN